MSADSGSGRKKIKMNRNPSLNFAVDEQYWFDGDKFLSSVIRSEIDVFSKEFNLLSDPVLNLLPACREYAREKYLHKEALEAIAYWCSDNSNKFDLEFEYIGLFFMRSQNIRSLNYLPSDLRSM